jgi:hypothetical protein
VWLTLSPVTGDKKPLVKKAKDKFYKISGVINDKKLPSRNKIFFYDTQVRSYQKRQLTCFRFNADEKDTLQNKSQNKTLFLFQRLKNADDIPMCTVSCIMALLP